MEIVFVVMLCLLSLRNIISEARPQSNLLSGTELAFCCQKEPWKCCALSKICDGHVDLICSGRASDEENCMPETSNPVASIWGNNSAAPQKGSSHLHGNLLKNGTITLAPSLPKSENRSNDTNFPVRGGTPKYQIPKFAKFFPITVVESSSSSESNMANVTDKERVPQQNQVLIGFGRLDDLPYQNFLKPSDEKVPNNFGMMGRGLSNLTDLDSRQSNDSVSLAPLDAFVRTGINESALIKAVINNPEAAKFILSDLTRLGVRDLILIENPDPYRGDIQQWTTTPSYNGFARQWTAALPTEDSMKPSATQESNEFAIYEVLENHTQNSNDPSENANEINNAGDPHQRRHYGFYEQNIPQRYGNEIGNEHDELDRSGLALNTNESKVEGSGTTLEPVQDQDAINTATLPVFHSSLKGQNNIIKNNVSHIALPSNNVLQNGKPETEISTTSTQRPVVENHYSFEGVGPYIGEHLGQRVDLCENQIGKFAAPDCRFYLLCYENNFADVRKCPAGFRFNPTIRQCDWPSRVPCVITE